jgi:hypothetical protein
MREKIDKLVKKLKDSETKHKMGVIAAPVSFGLLVASAVILVMSVIGMFLPAFEGIHFSMAVKLAGLGAFAYLVGRKWLTDKPKTKVEIEERKLLQEPDGEMLELNEKGEVLELLEKDKIEIEELEEIEVIEDTSK